MRKCRFSPTFMPLSPVAATSVPYRADRNGELKKGKPPNLGAKLGILFYFANVYVIFYIKLTSTIFEYIVTLHW